MPTHSITVRSFPFNPHGDLDSNIIRNEEHQVQTQNSKDMYTIFPRYAPFFSEGVEVYFTKAGTQERIKLTYGKDYYFGHQFMEASLSTTKDIYGSIVLTKRNSTGVIILNNYRTLGGDWMIDRAEAQKRLSEYILEPTVITYEQIQDLPYRFPVTNHNFNVMDLTGAKELVAAILELGQNLSGGGSSDAKTLSGKSYLDIINQIEQKTLNYITNYQDAELKNLKARVDDLFNQLANLPTGVEGSIRNYINNKLKEIASHAGVSKAYVDDAIKTNGDRLKARVDAKDTEHDNRIEVLEQELAKLKTEMGAIRKSYISIKTFIENGGFGTPGSNSGGGGSFGDGVIGFKTDGVTIKLITQNRDDNNPYVVDLYPIFKSFIDNINIGGMGMSGNSQLVITEDIPDHTKGTALPTQIIGQREQLLGRPTKYMVVTLSGEEYMAPLYLKKT